MSDDSKQADTTADTLETLTAKLTETSAKLRVCKHEVALVTNLNKKLQHDLNECNRHMSNQAALIIASQNAHNELVTRLAADQSQNSAATDVDDDAAADDQDDQSPATTLGMAWIPWYDFAVGVVVTAIILYMVA